MHNQITPGNTRHVATLLRQSQNVSRHTMSSREIAELTGKQHKHVKVDVEKMLTDLKEDAPSFRRIYLDSMNREQTEYLLDREHTDCLLTGYNAPLRMAVVRRWRELEQDVGAVIIPTTLPEALRLAADQAEENLRLIGVIELQAPKVSAIKRLAAAGGAICITDAAKHLQVAPSKLFSWLEQHRWIFRRQGSGRWTAYQPRITSGYLIHKVTSLKADPETGVERAAFDPLVTPKGLAHLAEINIGASL